MAEENGTIKLPLPKRFHNPSNVTVHVREPQKHVLTNAERIRKMTDEELAKFLSAVTCEQYGWCDGCQSLKGDYCYGINDPDNLLVKERLEWLKEKVE